MTSRSAPERTSPPAGEVTGRCAVHPSRPAADRCPTCGRERCGADAAAYPTGCLGCSGPGHRLGPRPASDLERLVRAALTVLLVGLFGGWVATQYIGAGAFAVIVPAVVGLGCGSAAAAVARTPGHGRLDLQVRTVAAVAAVAGTALAYKLVPGGGDPWSPAGTVVPAYAAAIAGAYLSRLLR